MLEASARPHGGRDVKLMSPCRQERKGSTSRGRAPLIFWPCRVISKVDQELSPTVAISAAAPKHLFMSINGIFRYMSMGSIV